MGYHSVFIEKGILGEISKIQEELDELKDAADQGAKILELCELADLVGAIHAYLAAHHPTYSFADLEKMANLTAQAFKEGER